MVKFTSGPKASSSTLAILFLAMETSTRLTSLLMLAGTAVS
jgi:hypothetical protein